MTDPKMSLRTLVEKSPDAAVLREVIDFAVERLMETEIGAHTGAEWARRARIVRHGATATASATGRHGRRRRSPRTR